jgi:hypothetical protein
MSNTYFRPKKSKYADIRRRKMNAARWKARKEAGKLPPKAGEVQAALDFLATNKVDGNDNDHS